MVIIKYIISYHYEYIQMHHLIKHMNLCQRDETGIKPAPCMEYLEYLPTKLGHSWECRYIFHTWS